MLYDQLLYLQAQRTIGETRDHLHGSKDHALQDQISRLKSVLRANYRRVRDDGRIPDHVYHEAPYRRGHHVSAQCQGRYWLPFFAPLGYGYRFDGFADVLVSLLDVADDDQRTAVDAFAWDNLIQDELPLPPAFHPVITPKDGAWEQLQAVYAYSIKNRPHEYHNGGPRPC